MAGASLLPDYYKEKMNIAVFMAPPAAVKLNPNAVLRTLSKPFYQRAITDALDTIGTWNFLPYNWVGSQVTSAVCMILDGTVCNWVMGEIFDLDPSIDYTERYDVFMSNVPAGSSAF